ncbi:MAG: hypothetical protein DRO01_00090 [Thermoproteota archaeon]|nr:MAG: hypothetical protein DRO01_00090 [Candidatus Korarchaeota archaeon]
MKAGSFAKTLQYILAGNWFVFGGIVSKVTMNNYYVIVGLGVAVVYLLVDKLVDLLYGSKEWREIEI